MEDQPDPPQYVVALRLEFEFDGGPPEMFRVIGRGTRVECTTIADRVPDMVYPGVRKVKRGSVVVVLAASIEELGAGIIEDHD